MKLSILDQSPIITGATPREALLATTELAKKAEALGFYRYWIAEHHGMNSLASSVPEVMLSYIGANTHKIRLGSGAVLLPHYKPYKIAEIYNMLQTLFPNRIDLGIGRAPGGSAQASIALSGNFLENVKNMPKSVSELLHFLYNDFPDNHMFAKLKAVPLPEVEPEVWMLGTSEKSARSAAELGLPYAFGHFMSEQDGPTIVETYKNHFQQGKSRNHPYTIVTVTALCAETEAEAKMILDKTNRQTKPNDSNKNNEKDTVIVGDPNTLKKELLDIQNQYKADEIMIVTITDDYQSRLKSYELIAKELINL